MKKEDIKKLIDERNESFVQNTVDQFEKIAGQIEKLSQRIDKLAAHIKYGVRN